MGLTSAQLDVIDLTPRIGSELRTDLETLLSGREAETIRATLDRRGVIFFRGLQMNDEQQVAIAKTLGNIVQNEGEGGIYKISLDKDVNQDVYKRQVPELEQRVALRALFEGVAKCYVRAGWGPGPIDPIEEHSCEYRNPDH